jgi:hypothetical protein
MRGHPEIDGDAQRVHGREAEPTQHEGTHADLRRPAEEDVRAEEATEQEEDVDCKLPSGGARCAWVRGAPRVHGGARCAWVRGTPTELWPV